MRRPKLISVFIITAIMILFSSFTAESAEKGGSSEVDYSGLNVLGGVFLVQQGDSRVMIEVKGDSLPAPEVKSAGTSEIVIAWPGTYVPSLNWSREYSYPLANRVTLEQDGATLVMRISVNEKLTVENIQGEAPSNVYRIYLKTHRVKAEEDMRKAPTIKTVSPVRSSDPFSANKKVNLDLRDVELRDVFRMFGDIVGMNIITDPSVPAAYVTMTLRDVPLPEAFGYLMKMYDVTYAIMGKTIIVGKADSLGKTLGKEKTRSYHVAYAEPQAVAGLLQGLAGVSNVVVDARLRTIYVTGRAEQFIKVERTLEKVDHPGRQIMLRARIIEVSDTARDELSSLLSAVYDRWWFNYSSAGTSVGYTYNNAPGAYDPDNKRGTSPLNVELGDVANGTLRLLDAGINSLVTENKGKVLADPSVITLDGETANIKLVENFKYISERDEAGNPTFDEEEVGPQLEFTPMIGRNGVITVELNVKTGEIIGTYSGSQGEEFPQTSTREVETVVRVRDGEPFVIGGLFKENQTTEKTKFPILGDIPLLGELFKNRSSTTTKNEVAIIVIPYILDVPEGPIESANL